MECQAAAGGSLEAMDAEILPFCSISGEPAPGSSVTEVAEQLAVASGQGQADLRARIVAVNRLSSTLEAAEEQFKVSVGDVQARVLQRHHHSIGKMLLVVKQQLDAYIAVMQSLLMIRPAVEGPEGDLQLAGCVAALRLMHACSVGGPEITQVPLRGSSLEELLNTWILLDDNKPPAVRGDAAPSTARTYLLEAQATYATGILASIIMVDPQASQAVVRSLVPASLMRYLRRCARAPHIQAGHEVGSSREAAALVAEAAQEMRGLRQRNVVLALTQLGDYMECLSPIIHERAVESCLQLLQREEVNLCRTAEVLHCMGTLLAHRRVAEMLAEAKGLDHVLTVAINLHTADGFSQILFGLSAVPLTFERLVARNPDRLTAAVLQILENGSNAARKNASLFLSNSLHYPALLAAFDARGGLRKLMNLLHITLHALRRADGADVKAERQLGYHIADTLSHYFRTHLIMHLHSLQRRLTSTTPSKQSAAAQRPVDVAQAAFDKMVFTLTSDPRLAEAFVQARWAALEDFMSNNGPSLMLDLVQASPGERYFTEMAMYALDVLGIVTLVPATRRTVLSCRMRRNRLGISIILGAAAGHQFMGNSEVMASALDVLDHCLRPPPALDGLLSRAATSARDRPASPSFGNPVAWAGHVQRGASPRGSELAAQLEATFTYGRKAMRAANGIKVVLTLLGGRPAGSAGSSGGLHPFCVRSLACRCLIGLARDPTMRDMLATLQVAKVLADSLQHAAAGAPIHRTAAAAIDSGATPPPKHTWHTYYNDMALRLIALTTSAGKGVSSSTVAVMPTGHSTTALQCLERAAAAAATPIAYQPAELLQLIAEHLRVSGLTASAETLSTEAGFTPSLRPVSTCLPDVSAGAAAGKGGPGRKTAAAAATTSGSSSPADASMAAAADGQLPPAKRRRLSVAPSLQAKPSVATTLVAEAAAAAVCTAMSAAQPGSALPAAAAIGPPLHAARSADVARAPSQQQTLAGPSAGDAAWLARQSSPAADAPAATAAASASVSISSLLAHLPCQQQRQRAVASGKSDAATSRSSAQRPAAGTTVTASAPVDSRLHGMVMAHLRAQHEAACAAAANPISTLAPISLLQPHVLPQATRREEAPGNAALRALRRQTVAPHGGFGGRKLERHLIHSRYRMVRSLRNEHLSLFKCAAFVDCGDQLLALGMHSGEVRLYDLESGELASAGQEAHDAPVNLLQVWPASGSSSPLLLSSSRQDVKLWDVCDLNKPPLFSFRGQRGGHFNRLGTQMATVASYNRRAYIHDVVTGTAVHTLQDTSETIGGGGERIQRCCRDVVMFSPTDELLIWGDQLWDPRSPRALHRFDSFTAFSTGYFHPAGLEVLLNSEVWDLRTRRLVRSAPALDGAAPVFGHPSSCVFYAAQRRLCDDLGVELSGRRARHPLHTAFRAIHAGDYGEISTTDADGRAVLSIAVDAEDCHLAAVTADLGEVATSSVRVYEIGRHPAQGDDSDGEDGAVDGDDSEDEEEDEEEESGDDDDSDDSDDLEDGADEDGAASQDGIAVAAFSGDASAAEDAAGSSQASSGIDTDDEGSSAMDGLDDSDGDGSAYMLAEDLEEADGWETASDEDGDAGGGGGWAVPEPPRWRRRFH